MNNLRKSKLYICHCVDTEGPLHEPLVATFQRLKEIYNIDLEPTKDNLFKIQNQKLDLGELTKSVSETFSNRLLSLNDTWEKIDEMLDNIMSKKFRNNYCDYLGNGIIYNWHCMDNVGFFTNERRRDIGFGNVFQHYKNKIAEFNSNDQIHWHFHPLSFNKDAHICSTSYDNSYEILHQILCRRLIDYEWFPIVNRAGFHAIRQDSSFFLEQWIPFDYSNQATYKNDDNQIDSNRFGDWRRASKKWFPYHPSYNDYQTSGNMNRLTTKCLNIGTRFKLLTQEEIKYAFHDAEENGKAILAFTNHDWRDMTVDIHEIYSLIHAISKTFKNVEIINSDAITAMQETFYDKEGLSEKKIKLNLEIINENGADKIVVSVIDGIVFGSQPYLAIKTNEGKYLHDNLNEREHLKSWEYILDNSTMKKSSIEKIVVASNDKYGRQSIVAENLLFN